MASLRILSTLATIAALSCGCTDASLGDLRRDPDGSAGATTDTPPSADAPSPQGDSVAPAPDVPAVASDAGLPSSDVVIPEVDVVTPGTDVVIPGTDVVMPGMDVVAPGMDVVAPGMDVVIPRPDVVTPRPDVVVPPPDLPTVCEACEPFATVAFCRGTGMGACLAYAGCVDRCARCIAPRLAGDTCASAPVISTQGRTRSVFTTCGATDNQSVGCGRTGLDFAVTLRVARAGRVVTRITVPEGVGVFFGYDRSPGPCRDQSSIRACNNDSPQRTQGFDLPLPAGDWNLYIATTAPATVVIETELP